MNYQETILTDDWNFVEAAGDIVTTIPFSIFRTAVLPDLIVTFPNPQNLDRRIWFQHHIMA